MASVGIQKFLTSCRHCLNEFHEIICQRIVVSFFDNDAQIVLGSLPSLTQIRIVKLDVVLHQVPHSFDWIKFWGEPRRFNRRDCSFSEFFRRSGCLMRRGVVLHNGEPWFRNNHTVY